MGRFLPAYRDYLCTNIALRVGFVCSPVALHPILVLLLPGDPQLLSSVLAAVAHVELIVHICETVAGQAISEVDAAVGCISTVHVVGHIAHALKPAGHHHTVLAQLQNNAQVEICTCGE